jgi:CRP/FNR family transcriptional regulator
MATFINDHKCQDCRYCFKKNDLFELLKKDELEYLNNNRLEVKFNAGEMIYKQGTPLTHIVILRNGYAKSYLEGANGRNLILSFESPHELIFGPGMFVDMRHHSSLSAASDCGACFMDISAFKAVLRQNSSFHEAFLRLYSEKVLRTHHQFVFTTQKNMEGRMAQAMLYLREEIFKGGDIKYVSKQDFADFTSMTRESAIRVIKDFRSEGLIEENKERITVLDEQALSKIMELA